MSPRSIAQLTAFMLSGTLQSPSPVPSEPPAMTHALSLERAASLVPVPHDAACSSIPIPATHKTHFEALLPAWQTTGLCTSKFKTMRRRAMQCGFCRSDEHLEEDCEEAEKYIHSGKCRHDVLRKIVLPSGARVPRNVNGGSLRDRLEEHYRLKETRVSIAEIARPQRPAFQNASEAASPATRTMTTITEATTLPRCDAPTQLCLPAQLFSSRRESGPYEATKLASLHRCKRNGESCLVSRPPGIHRMVAEDSCDLPEMISLGNRLSTTQGVQAKVVCVASHVIAPVTETHGSTPSSKITQKAIEPPNDYQTTTIFSDPEPFVIPASINSPSIPDISSAHSSIFNSPSIPPSLSFPSSIFVSVPEFSSDRHSVPINFPKFPCISVSIPDPECLHHSHINPHTPTSSAYITSTFPILPVTVSPSTVPRAPHQKTPNTARKKSAEKYVEEEAEVARLVADHVHERAKSPTHYYYKPGSAQRSDPEYWE
ncbi:hypothetical protein EDB89DRAFT_2062547 [Lactarius sanguifluus]|nr:hypothetical protein EDB89DRAFT_2062547 [Lactarius sanguifluus]